MMRPRPAANVDRSDAETVREMALRHLDRRGYGTAELKSVLVRQGADQDVVDGVLARLTAVGLLDDQAFAAALVEQRHDGRHMSRRAVAIELQRRGLPSDVVETATDGLDDAADWAGARQAAQLRMRRLAGLDEATARRRLAAALARKGYDASIVSGVVSQMMRERDGQ